MVFYNILAVDFQFASVRKQKFHINHSQPLFIQLFFYYFANSHKNMLNSFHNEYFYISNKTHNLFLIVIILKSFLRKCFISFINKNIAWSVQDQNSSVTEENNYRKFDVFKCSRSSAHLALIIRC